MNTKRIVAWMVFLGLAATAALTPAAAEVAAVDSQSLDMAGILYSHWPDGGGWPGRWEQVRTHVGEERLLNVVGDTRHDGAPDFTINPASGRAEVVWALWDGEDYEVAHAEWLGGAWSDPFLLTDNQVDDLDPKLSVLTTGGLGVTWWRDGTPAHVFHAARAQPDQPFGSETLVSDGYEPARTSCIASLGDATYVGYETMDQNLKTVVVEKKEGSGPFVPEIIASTSRLDMLDVRVFESGGHVWAVWVDSATHLGWSERAGTGWTSPEYEAYLGLNDIERARLMIKGKVIR